MFQERKDGEGESKELEEDEETPKIDVLAYILCVRELLKVPSS